MFTLSPLRLRYLQSVSPHHRTSAFAQIFKSSSSSNNKNKDNSSKNDDPVHQILQRQKEQQELLSSNPNRFRYGEEEILEQQQQQGREEGEEGEKGNVGERQRRTKRGLSQVPEQVGKRGEEVEETKEDVARRTYGQKVDWIDGLPPVFVKEKIRPKATRKNIETAFEREFDYDSELEFGEKKTSSKVQHERGNGEKENEDRLHEMSQRITPLSANFGGESIGTFESPESSHHQQLPPSSSENLKPLSLPSLQSRGSRNSNDNNEDYADDCYYPAEVTYSRQQQQQQQQQPQQRKQQNYPSQNYQQQQDYHQQQQQRGLHQRLPRERERDPEVELLHTFSVYSQKQMQKQRQRHNHQGGQEEEEEEVETAAAEDNNENMIVNNDNDNDNDTDVPFDNIALLARRIAIGLKKSKLQEKFEEYEEQEQKEERRKNIDILRKLRKTSRIATERRNWKGALGLLMAIRVAPFVRLGGEDRDDETSKNQKQQEEEEQMKECAETEKEEEKELNRAQVAVSLALSQILNKTSPNPEMLHSISNVVLSTTTTSSSSSPHETEDDDGTPSTSPSSSSSTTDTMTSLTTNFLLSVCIRRCGPQFADLSENLLFDLKKEIMKNNNLLFEHQIVVVPRVIQEAIPNAFTSVARNLGKSSNSEEKALSVLDEYFQLREKCFASCAPEKEEQEEEKKGMKLLPFWIRSPTPENLRCRLLVRSSSSSLNNKNDHWKLALERISELTLPASPPPSFDDSNKNNNNNNNSISSKLVVVPNQQSFLTALACIRSAPIPKTKEICDLVVDHLLPECFVSSSSSSFSVEAIECVSEIFKNAQNCERIIDRLISFVEGKQQNQEQQEEQHHEEQSSDNNNNNNNLILLPLFHPKIVSSLMHWSLFHKGDSNKVLALFHFILPETFRLKSEEHPLFSSSFSSSSSSFSKSSNSERRKLNLASLNSLASSVLFRQQVKFQGRRALEEQAEEQQQQELEFDEFDRLRTILTDTLLQLQKKADWNARKRERRRASEQQDEEEENKKNKDDALILRSLSTFLPSYYERGLYECISLFLRAAAASSSFGNVVSSSTSTSTSLLSSVDVSVKTVDEKKKTADDDDVSSSSLSSFSLFSVPSVNDIMSMLPTHSWRSEFLFDLLNFLYSRGAHGKISILYHSLQDRCSEFVNESETVFLSNPAAAGAVGRREEYQQEQEQEDVVHPEQMSFENFRHFKQQQKQDKMKKNRMMMMKSKHQQERDKRVQQRRSNNNNNENEILLPLCLDCRCLCLCARSAAEVGNWKLALRAYDEALTHHALSSSSSSSSSFTNSEKIVEEEREHEDDKEEVGERSENSNDDNEKQEIEMFLNVTGQIVKGACPKEKRLK